MAGRAHQIDPSKSDQKQSNSTAIDDFIRCCNLEKLLIPFSNATISPSMMKLPEVFIKCSTTSGYELLNESLLRESIWMLFPFLNVRALTPSNFFSKIQFLSENLSSVRVASIGWIQVGCGLRFTGIWLLSSGIYKVSPL